MDQMLPSPSFNIPSIGTPHHAMEEDQMIDRSAQAKQEQKSHQDHQRFFGSSGMTPHNLLSSGQTPHSLLASPAVHNQGRQRYKLLKPYILGVLEKIDSKFDSHFTTCISHNL